MVSDSGRSCGSEGEPAAAPPSAPTPILRAVALPGRPILLLDPPSVRAPHAPPPFRATDAPPLLPAPPASQVPPSVLLPLVEHALQQPPVQPVLLLVLNALMRFRRNSLETYRAFENSLRIAFDNFLALPTEVLLNYFWWTIVAIEVVVTLSEVIIEEFGQSHGVWIGLVAICFIWGSIFASIISMCAWPLTFDPAAIIECIVSFVNMLVVVVGVAARDLAVPLYWRLFLRFLVSIFIRIMWRIALRMARRQ